MSHGFANEIVFVIGETFPLFIDGTFTVATIPSRLPMEFDGTITGARFVSNTAPTGTAAICDVLKNGASSLWTVLGNQPDIAVAAFDSGVHTPEQNDTFIAGDYFQIAIDQIGSGVAGADGTVTLIVTHSIATNTIQQSFPIAIVGTFTVSGGLLRLPMEFDGEIESVRFVCNTAPTGASAICDVLKNGTDSLWTGLGNQPEILAGAFDSGRTLPEQNDSFIIGDFYHFDIDQIGSGVAGADGTIIVTVRQI